MIALLLRGKTSFAIPFWLLCGEEAGGFDRFFEDRGEAHDVELREGFFHLRCVGQGDAKGKQAMADIEADFAGEGLEEGKGFVLEFKEGIFLCNRAHRNLCAKVVDGKKVLLPMHVHRLDKNRAEDALQGFHWIERAIAYQLHKGNHFGIFSELLFEGFNNALCCEGFNFFEGEVIVGKEVFFKREGGSGS